MGTVYVFFADGFEEIEAFTSFDVMRRAGLNVEMITVTPDEIVKGAHGVPVLCDKNIVNCDFFDADLILLPGGMPGAATLEKCDLKKGQWEVCMNIFILSQRWLLVDNLSLL
jgi:4-methyl-5(b-hydroxyethyl)-thiazole monophosphate biosynthesis